MPSEREVWFDAHLGVTGSGGFTVRKGGYRIRDVPVDNVLWAHHYGRISDLMGPPPRLSDADVQTALDFLAGRRRFEHDVFLSHNREDSSTELAQRLTELGLTTWHDGDADMSDRAVRSKVDHALRQSRFVCLCVDSEYRDSEWVRYEYQAAKNWSERAHVVCLLVARMSPDAVAPDLVTTTIYGSQKRPFPSFDVYSRDGLNSLADFVRTNNRGDDRGALKLERHRLHSPGHGSELGWREKIKIGSEAVQTFLAAPDLDKCPSDVSNYFSVLRSVDYQEEGAEAAAQALSVLESLTSAPKDVRLRFIGYDVERFLTVLAVHQAGVFYDQGRQGIASHPHLRDRAYAALRRFAEDAVDTVPAFAGDPDAGRRNKRCAAYRKFADDLCRGVEFKKAHERLQRALWGWGWTV